jgi:hypothetical protein
MNVQGKSPEIPFYSDIVRIGRIPWFEQYASEKLGLSMNEIRTRTFDQLLKLLQAKHCILPDPPRPVKAPPLPQNKNNTQPATTSQITQLPVAPTPPVALNTRTGTTPEDPVKQTSSSALIDSKLTDLHTQARGITTGPPGYMQSSPKLHKVQRDKFVSVSKLLSIPPNTEPLKMDPKMIPNNTWQAIGSEKQYGFPNHFQGSFPLQAIDVKQGPPSAFKEKEKLIQQGQEFWRQLKDLDTFVPILQSTDEEADHDLRNCLREWYESTIATRKRWLITTAEKYVRQLECQKRLEDELKKSILRAHDETDVMAFTFDTNRKRIELESLLTHIETLNESLKEKIHMRQEIEEEWMREDLLSQELMSYFLEKRRLLHDFIMQLEKLSENIRPFFKVTERIQDHR